MPESSSVAVYCSVLQCVAIDLQCVAVCCSVLHSCMLSKGPAHSMQQGCVEKKREGRRVGEGKREREMEKEEICV